MLLLSCRNKVNHLPGPQSITKLSHLKCQDVQFKTKTKHVNEEEVQWDQNPRETIGNRNRHVRNPDNGIIKQKP